MNYKCENDRIIINKIIKGAMKGNCFFVIPTAWAVGCQTKQRQACCSEDNRGAEKEQQINKREHQKNFSWTQNTIGWCGNCNQPRSGELCSK